MNKIISVKNKCIQTKEIAGFSFSDESFSQLKEKVIGKKLMAVDSNSIKDWIGNIIEATDNGFKVEIVNPKFEHVVCDGIFVNLDILTLNDGDKIEEVMDVNKIVVKTSNKFDEVEIRNLEK